MIAADTSAVLHFLHGFDSPARAAVRAALVAERLVLPPVVLTELLSAPLPEPALERLLGDAPLLPVVEGYWLRAASTRRRILGEGFRARLADTLIAQSCLDADVPLITGDTDFRRYVELCGLKLEA